MPFNVGNSKFMNQKTVLDGIKFDSKREANRWFQLKLLERAGEIVNLERQKAFKFVINDVNVCTYRSDFSYKDRSGAFIVEDVKSDFTKKIPTYVIKKKLMKAVYGIEIREV